MSAPAWDVDNASLELFSQGLAQGSSSWEWFRLRRELEEIALNPGVDRLVTLDCNTIKELPHQIDVALHVLRNFKGRAILADEVGLGKTIEAGIILKELGVRGLARRVLILTPASLVEQWQAELDSKFFEEFATPTEPADWHHVERAIVSYDRACGDRHAAAILQHRWDLVIVDEAHKVKNHVSERYKFLKQVDRNFILLLTATPLQNNLRELYNLITLLRPGQLGTWAQFQREHVVRGDPRRARSPEALRELTSQVMVRTRRASVAPVINLPPRKPTHPDISLTRDEAVLYRETVAFLRDLYRHGLYQPSEREETEDRARRRRRRGRGMFTLELMRLLQRLTSSAQALGGSLEALSQGELLLPEYRIRGRQLADRARSVTTQAKLEVFCRFLSGNGDRVIVFTEHLPTLALLEKAAEDVGRPAISFAGSLSRAERSRSLARFRQESSGVLLATRIGSEGLNLQFCHQLVNYELPWNPMIIEQRIGRVHRIGQQREVSIINLAARDTIEMQILRLLDQKIQLFQLVVGELDTILGEFGGADTLEKRLTDAWVSAESDEAFERQVENIGNEILASREAGLAQEQLASEVAAEDNAGRLEREFRHLSVPGRVRLAYGTSHLALARGVEGKRHQLELHVSEILEAMEVGAVERAGSDPGYGPLYRITGVTGRGRAIVLRVQADRLPMTLVDIEADAEAPLVGAAS
ncbi:MAG: DEAD/DEAH box helicase [Gemmatimonadetes bacterium]|nr:DEAD/DEAH box helicase [Gemmatimonadota bacterium]